MARNSFRLLSILPRQLVLQIPILVVFLLVVTIVVYTWIAASNQLKITESNIHLLGSTLSKNIAVASADYVLADNYASLEQLLLQAADYPEVQRIQVSDNEGRILSDVIRVEGGLPRAQYGSSDIVLPTELDGHIHDHINSVAVHWHPVDAGDILGWVRVQQSMDRLNTIAIQMWRDSLITGLIGILISASIIFLFLKKPMRAMRKASEFAMRLDKSEGSKLEVTDSGFEIQQLEKSLNSASRRLYEANKDLKDQKFALDQSSIVCIADVNRQITYANEKFCEISGYHIKELKGLNQYFLCVDYHKEEFFNEIWSKVLHGEVWRGEMKNRKKNGDSFWVDATVVPFLDVNDKPYQFVSIQKDITDKKIVEEKLFQNEYRMRSILENTGDGVITIDEAASILSFNRAAEIILGYSADKAIGQNFTNLVTDSNNESEKSVTRSIYEASRETYPNNNIELIGLHKTGFTVPLELTVSKMKESNKNIYIISMRDITDRIETEEHLRHLAHHDTLTGLPNRTAFLERLEHAIALCQRRKDEIAVLFMDIDHFKLINDTLGHDIGDKLLKGIAERLVKCVRKGDTVARLGGDEFTFLLEDISSSNDIPAIVDKIIETISKPIMIDDRELFITTSVGISRYPGDGDSGFELLKNADTAMYRAKEEGRNNYQFYSVEMGKKAHDRLSMETYLRQALQHNEFYLEYQPQYDVKSGKVISLEALVRWNHPEKGVVSPLEFVPLLEDTGLIVPVGEWILETACRHCAEWNTGAPGGVSVFVNLSARQFRENNFISMIERILKSSGLKANQLGIEITESILMRYSAESMDILETCSKMGINFALDDFGTGYSSLSYLKRFPINTIKIDKSFIRDIHQDSENGEIVKAILAMGESLNLKVVAEGVETEDELNILRKWGCKIIQGYLFSRPIGVEKVPQILASESLPEQSNEKIKKLI